MLFSRNATFCLRGVCAQTKFSILGNEKNPLGVVQSLAKQILQFKLLPTLMVLLLNSKKTDSNQ